MFIFLPLFRSSMARKNHVYSPSPSIGKRHLKACFFTIFMMDTCKLKVNAYCGVSRKATQLLFRILSFVPLEDVPTVTDTKWVLTAS